MYLEELHLQQYRNYAEASYRFAPGLNIITGDNGLGKTNLLDAIYFLSFTRSSLSGVDAQHIQHGKAYFTLEGRYQMEGESQRVRIAYQSGQKKQVYWGAKLYEKISEHIGRLPLVMVGPYDTDLIREGSETRRRWADAVICQYDRAYLQNLMTYNRYLLQRNALLKQFAEDRRFDAHLLAAYTQPLYQPAQAIYAGRRAFLAAFLPLLQAHYRQISEGREAPELQLESPLAQQGVEEGFTKAQAEDCRLQRSTFGPHKTDWRFGLSGRALKKYGSQGQQKSFVIALRLAQLQLLAQKTARQPLLLMDDIFDKLDENRIARLLELAVRDGVGQVFMTDARPERTRRFIAELPGEKQTFDLNREKPS